ncbi:T9SS type A sorting domain-containing protein [Taibaiella chishuiensis]|uniref:Putative secreted protein (Por secretion system target) n=1 Tax=Taibaiella chishuiensis TaxID=1434707 RepID=A0A2P8DAC1_9BACT|nr:T9SS type A sorting domain-containing protein [Taibaiella chishuiensis]PSK94168.1 putative secreted protein (Por secretion system target) [Taibaiella chishuiensis]
MKTFFLVLLLVVSGCLSYAQPDSNTIWFTRSDGAIYQLDVNNCSTRLYCNTGKRFMDIAFTPDGNLWGNTEDSLFQIYSSGYSRAVGKIPLGNGLIGLNNSTLLIDSLHYLLALNTNNARTKLIGNINFNLDGDFAWMDQNLYAIGQAHLTRITFTDNYQRILSMNSIAPDTALFTPALASLYSATSGYQLFGLPGNAQFFQIDTTNVAYNEMCVVPAAVTAYGASSKVFPPPQPTSSRDVQTRAIEIIAYPNPAKDKLCVVLKNFSGNRSEVELLLYNIGGTLLDYQAAPNLLYQFDLGEYPPGSYTLTLRYHGQIQCKSIVVSQ